MTRRTATFPKYGGKYSFEPVFSAEEHVRQFYAGREIPPVPPKAALIFDSDFEAFLSRQKWLTGAPGLYSMSRNSLKSTEGRLGVYRLGIGAPMAAIAVEELRVQGASEFLVLGLAGGLALPAPGDLVLCTKALRDEGVSHHYLGGSRYALPDRRLTAAVREGVKERGLMFRSGPSWTTDAPYRESRRELERYVREGILTVEMEAAAVFATCRSLGARAAAALMVSDVLTSDGWTGFVKGIAPGDFAPLAEVADVFRSVDLKN